MTPCLSTVLEGRVLGRVGAGVVFIDSNEFVQEQVMRVVRRSVQGDHPTPGRGQAIAPPMDEPGKPLRGHTCRYAASSLLICYYFPRPFRPRVSREKPCSLRTAGERLVSPHGSTDKARAFFPGQLSWANR